MTAPGPTVTSGGDTQPGADSLFPTGFGGGGASVRPGGVGTGEILDGSVAAADVNLASVGAALAAHSTFTSTFTRLLTTDAVSTSASGTLVAWHLTPVDATAAPATWTLPAANSVVAGVEVAVKKADTSTNTVTVSRAGSDLIFGTGSGSTSKTLTLAGEAVTLVSDGVSKWTVQTSDTPSGVLANTYARKSLRPLPRLNQALPAIHPNPPTIAYNSANAATSLSNPKQWNLASGAVRLVGQAFASQGTDANGADYLAATNTTGNEYPAWYFGFYTDAPVLELTYQGNATPSFRLIVDRYAVTADVVTAGGATDGQRHRVLVTFPDRRPREIIVESGTFFASGVVTTGIDTVWPLIARPRMGFMGDSVIQNGGINGIGQTAARIVGCEWVMNSSGGTGYNNQGGAGHQTFIQRLPLFLSQSNLDYLVTCGGINDGTGTLLADVTAYATLAAQTLAPERVFFTGPWRSSTDTGSAAAKRDIIKAGALAAGCQFVDNIAELWETGTGNNANLIGDGNSDLYIGSDNTHPVYYSGFTYLGARLGLDIAAKIGL